MSASDKYGVQAAFVLSSQLHLACGATRSSHNTLTSNPVQYLDIGHGIRKHIWFKEQRLAETRRGDCDEVGNRSGLCITGSGRNHE